MTKSMTAKRYTPELREQLVNPLAVLFRELEGGLEEIHEQPRGAVQSRDDLRGGNTLEAAVAQELRHDSAVFSLDPRLVILAIGPRAIELDLMAEAVLDQRLVHKLAVVIDVQRTKRKGQSLSNTFQRLDERATLSHHQGRGVGPTADDVGQKQTVDVAAALDISAMRDAVNLHTPRRGLVPVRGGAHRHAPAHRRHSAAGLPQA